MEKEKLYMKRISAKEMREVEGGNPLLLIGAAAVLAYLCYQSYKYDHE